MRILNNLGIVSRYDSSKPIFVSEAKFVMTNQGIDFVLRENGRFKRFTQFYTNARGTLANEDGSIMPSFDDKRDWILQSGHCSRRRRSQSRSVRIGMWGW